MPYASRRTARDSGPCQPEANADGISPLALAILFLALALPSRASTSIAPADDATISAQMYRDEAALYPSVGKVTGSGFSGSGVLIGPQWILQWIQAQTGLLPVPEPGVALLCLALAPLALRRRRP